MRFLLHSGSPKAGPTVLAIEGSGALVLLSAVDPVEAGCVLRIAALGQAREKGRQRRGTREHVLQAGRSEELVG